MARFAEGSRVNIDTTAERWRDRSLIGDASFTHPDSYPQCWASTHVLDLHRRFLGNPLVGAEGGGTFASKWQIQLEGASPEVKLLAGEILTIYYLATQTVGRATKVARINETINDPDLQFDPLSTEPHVLAMDEWIGNPGGRYNMRQDTHVGYLIDLALRLKQRPTEERQELLVGHPWDFGDFADDIGAGVSVGEMRHLVCHLLYPDYYERMASGTHKRQVLSTFGSVAPDSGEESMDRRLLAVREALQEQVPDVPRRRLDFYRPPLEEIWRSAVDTGDELSDLAALEHKRQIVYYGPPGTGKTYRARQLAEALIRGAALKRWGVASYFTHREDVNRAVTENVTRLQLHPGVGYPEFMIGLQLDEHGGTRFMPGILPRLIKSMLADGGGADGQGRPGLPRVLILDEINRTDLSAMFGEAFSALEGDKRNEPIQLPGTDDNGQPFRLAIPDDLFIIGTMNEIDHSVEALDFALRRRFFWFREGFDEDGILAIWRHEWERQRPRIRFDEVRDELDRLIFNIHRVNKLIAERPELGQAYELGHAFFVDLPFFVKERWPTRKPYQGRILWTAKDQPLTPLTSLWKYTVRPLVEQYLAAADDRDEALRMVENAFYGHG